MVSNPIPWNRCRCSKKLASLIKALLSGKQKKGVETMIVFPTKLW
jgi:hypothetical protein